MAYAFGVELDVARLGDKVPEKRHSGGHCLDRLAHRAAHLLVGVAHKLVELHEEARIGGLFNHRHHPSRVALAIFALEGERSGCEDATRYAVFAQPLHGFKGGAAARAAAEGGHDHREPHAFEQHVERTDRIFGRESCRHHVAPRAVAAEAVAADKHEWLAALARSRVGVDQDVAYAALERRGDFARYGTA